MKLPYTEVKFHPEVKSQTGLISLWVSCKRAPSLFFYMILHPATRSSRSQMFFKIDVPKKFANITGKHLCQSPFFNKVANLMPPTLLKKRLQYRCFPVNFAKLLRTPLFLQHLRWLLLATLSNINNSKILHIDIYYWFHNNCYA